MPLAAVARLLGYRVPYPYPYSRSRTAEMQRSGLLRG
jgi:hypothetical protein